MPGRAGTIAGTVTVEGNVEPLPALEITVDGETCGRRSIPDPTLLVSPEGYLQNAVVMLAGDIPGEWRATRWTLAHRGCQLVPHVVVVPVGRKLQIENEDGLLHTFHSLSSVNAATDVPQPPSQRLLERVWQKPEAFRVECDVHSFASAFVVVAENPYVFVTLDDGSFALKNVPDGSYTLVVVHERLGRIEKSVTVKGEKPLIVDVAMPIPGSP